MEEDLKILEEFIKKFYESFAPEIIIYNPEIKALENLIKGYRKLKLENQALENTQQNCPMMNTSGFQCEHKVEDITHIVNKAREDFVKQYIPKSKIKKKIEELENLKVQLPVEHLRKAQIKILQELLEEE